jgi:hypothetical protein
VSWADSLHRIGRSQQHAAAAQISALTTAEATSSIGQPQPMTASFASSKAPDLFRTVAKTTPTFSRLQTLPPYPIERTSSLDNKKPRCVVENRIVERSPTSFGDTYKSSYPSFRMAPVVISRDVPLEGRQNIICRQVAASEARKPGGQKTGRRNERHPECDACVSGVRRCSASCRRFTRTCECRR